MKKMNTFRDSIYAGAKDNIIKFQQKRDYDKKRRKMKVCVLIVYTPVSI